MFQNVSNDSVLGDVQLQDQHVKILHIEDSVADQALARLSLKRGPLSCTLTAVDTLPAIEDALQKQTFDLILADYYLPGFTALDVWELVRTRADAPPFVLLSGAIGESAAVDIMRLGISDYLLKDQISSLHMSSSARWKCTKPGWHAAVPCRSWPNPKSAWPN